MLFNSPAFLFAYLPVVWGVAAWLQRQRGTQAVVPWLAAASLAFYALSSLVHLPLLVLSVALNAGISRLILGAEQPTQARRWLLLGLGANIGVLVWFKYWAFFVGAFSAASGLPLQVHPLDLPVGISFYTFTQIAYLVDCQRRQVQRYGLGEYALFVSYFPHLVAGPILHHRDTIAQFRAPAFCAFDSPALYRGTVLFSLGLAKKVLLADSLAPCADATFHAASDGVTLTLWEAWLGLLAYSFQIYFDFSGYSDMALGLSLAMGVRIPINFMSPYRAGSIIEFWRRWHISLSSFLRDYVYIPLGGNRQGPARRHVNILLTMLLGGLWHGAGWGFVVWGALHGVFLVVNHLWRQHAAAGASARSAWWAHGLTLLAVACAWAFFRADTIQGAVTLLSGAFGGHGLALPQSLGGPTAIGMFANDLTEEKLAWCAWVAGAACVAFWLPRSTQLARAEPLPSGDGNAATAALPTLRVALLAATLAAGSLLMLQRQVRFLYFQF